MPLKLNVGLCRKIGDANFGSHGANINVEMEADSGLISEPDKLKERLRQLFTMARNSLNDELNGHAATVTTSNGSPPATNGHGANGNGHQANPISSSNGYGAPHVNGQSTTSNGYSLRPATQSQVKAIFAIARTQRLDVEQFLRDRFGVSRPVDLSIKDASTVIDQLKSTQTQRA